VLLLTGRPGSGKTTVVRQVAASLSGPRVAGFYTEEIRVRGQREGFRLVTLDGRERVMAHVGFRGPHRVGRYGVDTAVVDETAGALLAAARDARVFLIDEIGKMECLAPTFVTAMRRLLDSPATVVATVAARGGGFIAEVKERRDALLWEVTRANRDDLPGRIARWLQSR
jgi:nucleoside-triphosphatase